MQLPIVAPAPSVTAHAEIFRALCEHRCPFRHCHNDLPGLSVLDNKSLAHITRGVLESADKTHLARFFSDAPGFQEQGNDRRVTYLLQQTTKGGVRQVASALLLADPVCAHGGSLCEYGDRHYNPGDDPDPLAHQPVTRYDVSGPGRFPVARRL